MIEMKNTLHYLLVAIALTIGPATHSFAFEKDLTSIDLSSHREVVLTAFGLSCPLCANNLDGQLTKIDGVESAVINLATGSVNVRLAKGHSVKAEQLVAAVDNSGFTLKKIELISEP